MQVIFAYTVFLAGLAFLLFLAVPRLRRHAFKATAAVFGFCAVGSMFVAAVAYGLSEYTKGSVPCGAVGAMAAMLVCAAFSGGGFAGAWLAIRAMGWVQTRVLEERKRF